MSYACTLTYQYPSLFFQFLIYDKSLFSVQIFDTFLIIFQAFISQKTTPGIEKFRMLFSAQNRICCKSPINRKIRSIVRSLLLLDTEFLQISSIFVKIFLLYLDFNTPRVLFAYNRVYLVSRTQIIKVHFTVLAFIAE